MTERNKREPKANTTTECFTDEDLEITKNELKLGYTTLTTAGEFSGMKALLRRLECAEKALEAHYKEDNDFHSPDEAYDLWLQASGKTGRDGE